MTPQRESELMAQLRECQSIGELDAWWAIQRDDHEMTNNLSRAAKARAAEIRRRRND